MSTVPQKPTPDEDVEHDVELDSASSSENLLESLAEAREETSEDRETFIPIPGYEKANLELLARYRLLSGLEIEAITRKVFSGGRRQRRSFQSGLNAACDVMARACTGIFIQRPTDPQPIPLTVDGQPIANYGDTRLKKGLKIPEEIDTARGVIIAVFCDNELAVVTHSAQLQSWFGNTNADLDAEFLGEGR